MIRTFNSPNNNAITFTVLQANVGTALNAIALAARMWFGRSPSFEMYVGIAADALLGDKSNNIKLLKELFLLPFFSVVTPDVSANSTAVIISPKSCNCSVQVNRPQPITLIQLVL